MLRCLFILCVLVVAVTAATVNVPCGAGADPAHCYEALQDAYDKAGSGDVLELEDGIYAGGDDTMLTINKDVTLRAHNVKRAVLDGEFKRRVLNITKGVVVLDGLAITGGRVTGYNTPASEGGGMHVSGSAHVTVSLMDIYSNYAGYRGGGICIGGFTGWARLTIIGTNIFSNTADYGYGGGIFIDNNLSTLVLSNTNIYSNTVHAHGGGIFSAPPSSPNITNITADNQTAIFNNDREQCYGLTDAACGRQPLV